MQIRTKCHPKYNDLKVYQNKDGSYRMYCSLCGKRVDNLLKA